ncbi:MAG: hypothetical protein ACOX1J_01520 [Dethiobacteria bacterium]
MRQRGCDRGATEGTVLAVAFLSHATEGTVLAVAFLSHSQLHFCSKLIVPFDAQ